MIVDLHARHGAADEPEAIKARLLLLNCLHENGKDWTLLTLIRMGLGMCGNVASGN